ncbi:hypothetical protein H9Q69_005418 [Fusarium xylarioides]|nr:hypothetical protein H9Q69_005418 [Fusarium xylarioides]
MKVVSLTAPMNNHGKQSRSQFLNSLLRRPYLKEMELSCSNAQALIPFIDLINEVLESYIRYKPDPALSTTPKDSTSINVYNSPIDDNEIGDGHQDEVYRPRNIDNKIYTEIIAGRMFLFTHFPYSLPKDIITQFFATLRVQIPDLSPRGLQLATHIPCTAASNPGYFRSRTIYGCGFEGS